MCMNISIIYTMIYGRLYINAFLRAVCFSVSKCFKLFTLPLFYLVSLSCLFVCLDLLFSVLSISGAEIPDTANEHVTYSKIISGLSQCQKI